MMDGCKSWMNLPRHEKEFMDGVKSFLNFSYSIGNPQGEEILCPCSKCCNLYWYRKDVIYEHLICNGFVKGYTTWVNHGENVIGMDIDSDKEDEVQIHDDIEGLLNDRFRDVTRDEGVHEDVTRDEGVHEDVARDLKEKDHDHQKIGESAERAFQAVFGKERPGRVRCYGRTITATSLKREKEINRLKEEHAKEKESLETQLKEINEKLQELHDLVSVLMQKNNPTMNIDDLLSAMRAKQSSPGDGHSACDLIGLSSTSTHVPKT